MPEQFLRTTSLSTGTARDVLHWFATRAAFYLGITIGTAVLFIASAAVYSYIVPRPPITPQATPMPAPPVVQPTPSQENIPGNFSPLETDPIVAAGQGNFRISTAVGLPVFASDSEPLGKISKVYSSHGQWEGIFVSTTQKEVYVPNSYVKFVVVCKSSNCETVMPVKAELSVTRSEFPNFRGIGDK
jgi:hypothetical protein